MYNIWNIQYYSVFSFAQHITVFFSYVTPYSCDYVEFKIVTFNTTQFKIHIIASAYVLTLNHLQLKVGTCVDVKIPKFLGH